MDGTLLNVIELMIKKVFCRRRGENCRDYEKKNVY